jgi:hypothetical protein
MHGLGCTVLPELVKESDHLGSEVQYSTVQYSKTQVQYNAGHTSWSSMIIPHLPGGHELQATLKPG